MPESLTDMGKSHTADKKQPPAKPVVVPVRAKPSDPRGLGKRAMDLPIAQGRYLSPVNGLKPGIVNCSVLWSCFSRCLIYAAIRLVFLPVVSTQYPLHQSSRFRYLYFNSPNCSYSIPPLFPFRYPIKLDTAVFGGISTSMGTWSGHTSASTFFPTFRSHSPSVFSDRLPFLSINTFCRYFGAKAILF